MVGGIGNNGGPPPGIGRALGNTPSAPVDKTATPDTVNSPSQANTSAANRPEVLQGQMQAAQVLGKSQVNTGPMNSMKALMQAIPPGSNLDKKMDLIATNVLNKQDPGFNELPDMEKALKISDIRLQMMESPELSQLLGIKL
jgi:uncharacterized protein (DUF2342 family)